jgi:hypothetical protein
MSGVSAPNFAVFRAKEEEELYALGAWLKARMTNKLL